MMDTSIEYIKMCEKAEEIQKLWKPTVADFHTSYDWKEVHTVEFDYDSSEIDILGCPPHIWLPRQDQLQEMLIDKIGGNHIALLSVLIRSDLFCQAGLGHYVSSPNYNYTNSMEQLWLVFVMKEKYNKIWNGEDWVKK